MKTYPMFYKVYIPDLSSQKLMIPPKFAMKFGDELSDVACLSASDGRVWQLGITKSEKNIYFDERWHEFVENYALLQGYILVFSYRGSSNFDISVYDMSSCEIDYLLNGLASENNHGHDRQEKSAPDANEASCDGSDIQSSSKEKVSHKRTRNQAMKKRHNSVVSDEEYCPSVQSEESSRDEMCVETPIKKSEVEHNKKIRVSTSDSQPSISPVTGATTALPGNNDAATDDILVEREDDFNMIVGNSFSRQCEKLSKEGKRTIREAKLFKPENPSFMFIVTQWNFNSGCMHVPAEFVKKYWQSEWSTLIVQDSEERDWHCKIRWRKSAGNCGGLVLKKGWRKFAWNNDLKNEDICILELIQTNDVVLKATTFHTTKQ